MKIFITGANGFVGKHLVAELTERGHEVCAGMRHHTSSLPLSAKPYYYTRLDYDSFYALLKEIKPDGIIHLAAQSKVSDSWSEPVATFSTNTVGTLHLIQAAKDIVPKAKIMTIGSSEEYGLTGKAVPSLTEEHPCLPQNPYATSKFSMGQVSLQLAQKHDLNVLHVRAFNHFGPYQQEGFVISDFASQIARIEKGLSSPTMKVGDLNVIRDFTDVRDVVKAYSLLLENKVSSGIYNICSGHARKVNDILQSLLQRSTIPIQIQVDAERFRPSDVPKFLGCPQKLKEATAWKPEIPFEQSLFDTLQFWRMQVE